MFQFDALAHPLLAFETLGLHHFADQHGFVGEFDCAIHTDYLFNVVLKRRYRLRVAVNDVHAAHFDFVGELDLGIDAGNPILIAPLIDFEGHAYENRIEVFVQTRHRRAE